MLHHWILARLSFAAMALAWNLGSRKVFFWHNCPGNRFLSLRRNFQLVSHPLGSTIWKWALEDFRPSFCVPGHCDVRAVGVCHSEMRFPRDGFLFRRQEKQMLANYLVTSFWICLCFCGCLTIASRLPAPRPCFSPSTLLLQIGSPTNP